MVTVVSIPIAFMLHFGWAIHSKPADTSFWIFSGEKHTVKPQQQTDRQEKKKFSSSLHIFTATPDSKVKALKLY